MAGNYLEQDEKCWGMGGNHIFILFLLGQWLHEGFHCPPGKERSMLAGWAAVSVHAGAVAGGTGHPLTLLMGTGGRGCSHGWTHTMDGPLHPPVQRLFVVLTFIVIVIGPTPPSATRVLHDRYGPFCPRSGLQSSVPAAVSSAQGINGLLLLLCFPHLSYGISTPYCPFYFLYLLL